MSPLRLPIETPRLVLRPFVDEDLEALYAIQSRADVARYLYWEPRTRDEVAEQLQRLRRMTGFDGESEGLRLAGCLRSTGELVGDYSLWRTSREHQQGEIGFITDPRHQGHGYAMEASRALLAVGFGVYRLHRIVGSCDARNGASAAVMERLGMRREAHFVENELVKGEWQSELVFAVLRSEWAAAHH